MDDVQWAERVVSSVNLGELPDKSLILVLSKLPLSSLAILSCTSRRLHALCHNPQFWTSVRIDDSRSPITPFSMMVLCGKGPFLRHLCVDLHRTMLPDSVIHFLANSCPSIISLSLFMSSSPHSGTTNVFPIDALAAFLTNSKFIRSLRFVNSPLIDDSHLVRVLPHLQMIREIDLSGCGSLSDSTLIKLAQQCPSLQLLDISRLGITGRCIEQIFRYCSGLQILRANGCADFQHGAFDLVHAESLQTLTELSVVRTPAHLEHALPQCGSLRCLLASVSLHDSLLIPFLLRARRLEVLHMGSGCQVTNSSLLCAVQNCGQNLRSLTFHPFEDFAVPGDEAVRMICVGCPRLRNLSLGNAREVSTHWVLELLDRLDLESLALFGWENASSATFRIMAGHVTRLRMICITGCRKVVAQAVVALVTGGRQLKVAKFAESGVNDAEGRIAPDVIEGIRATFPTVKESPFGTLLLR
jgi:hypothetical protein